MILMMRVMMMICGMAFMALPLWFDDIEKGFAPRVAFARGMGCSFALDILQVQEDDDCNHQEGHESDEDARDGSGTNGRERGVHRGLSGWHQGEPKEVEDEDDDEFL